MLYLGLLHIAIPQIFEHLFYSLALQVASVTCPLILVL